MKVGYQEVFMKPETSLQSVPQDVPVKPNSVPSFWTEANDLFKKTEARAFELFERRGRQLGRELEDWFTAEHELFKPIAVEMIEKDNLLVIRAEVPGFRSQDLEISLEPEFVVIKGHQTKETESETEKTFYSETKSNNIFRKMALPFAVLADAGEATLKEGVLEIRAPKAAVDAKKLSIVAA
jgi:HSP20 family molecular chaperone IbpA